MALGWGGGGQARPADDWPAEQAEFQHWLSLPAAASHGVSRPSCFMPQRQSRWPARFSARVTSAQGTPSCRRQGCQAAAATASLVQRRLGLLVTADLEVLAALQQRGGAQESSVRRPAAAALNTPSLITCANHCCLQCHCLLPCSRRMLASTTPWSNAHAQRSACAHLLYPHHRRARHSFAAPPPPAPPAPRRLGPPCLPRRTLMACMCVALQTWHCRRSTIFLVVLACRGRPGWGEDHQRAVVQAQLMIRCPMQH